MKPIDIGKIYNRKCKCCNTKHFATMFPPCLLCGHRAKPYIVSYNKKLDQFLKKLNKITLIQWSYLAGLMDGEGSIGLYYDKRKIGTGIVTRVHLLVNTDYSLIEYVANLIGKEYIYKMRNDTWTVTIWHRAFAEVFLKKIIPFLIAKKKRAENALKFIELRKGRFHSKYSDEELLLVELSKKGNSKMGRALWTNL